MTSSWLQVLSYNANENELVQRETEPSSVVSGFSTFGRKAEKLQLFTA